MKNINMERRCKKRNEKMTFGDLRKTVIACPNNGPLSCSFFDHM